METSYEYVTFGEIQQYKKQWWKEHQQGIGFEDVLLSLCKNGKTHFGIPHKPDFMSWDLKSLDHFRSLTDQIPVNVQKELHIRKQRKDHVVFLEVTKTVHIGLESVYTQEQLFSMSYFTVLYVLSGMCRLHLSDRTVEMKSGELCILSPYTPFYAFTTPGDVVINISSERALFEEQFRALLFQDNPVSDFFRLALFEQNDSCLFFMIPPTKDLKNIIQHLFQESVIKDSCSSVISYNLVQILYSNIIRSSQNTRNYYENRSGNSITTMMPAILEYIENNFNNITLDSLAYQFHYDPAYLSREIKSQTGTNFASIITNLRLLEATRLLDNTDMSVAAVAKQCGYSSSSHFCVAFKNRFGVSASAYRTSKK